MIEEKYLTYNLGLDYKGFIDLLDSFLYDYEFSLYDKIVTYSNTEILVYENHAKYMALIFIKSNHLTEEELYMIENEYLYGYYKGEVFKKVFTIICVDRMYDIVENYLKLGTDIFHSRHRTKSPLYYRYPFVFDVSKETLILSNSASFRNNNHPLIHGYYKELDRVQNILVTYLESFFKKNKYNVGEIKSDTTLFLDVNSPLYYPKYVVLFKKDFYVNSDFSIFVIIFFSFLILPFINSFKKDFIFYYLFVFSLILFFLFLFFASMKSRVYKKSKNCKMIWLGSDVTKLCETIAKDNDFVFVDSFDNCSSNDGKLYLIKKDGCILINNSGNSDILIKKLITLTKKFLN